jgi:nitroreductase
MEEYAPIRRLVLGEAHMLTLLRQRRSVRRYKSKAVPRETIERILAAAQCAPTGTSHSSTGVIVIDQAKTLAQFSELVYQLYEKLEAGLRNPIARTFIKRSVRAKEYHTLQEFLMPGMHWYIRWYREGKSNEILRDCPALLLFHSPVDEPVGAENCVIAAFHAILMAETLGVGTCFNDILPSACNRSVEIRQMLALPEGREVYASVTMGYPKYRFRKAPPRKLAEVRYLD